ncbi:MAG: NUMOD3 domain-containing DNA-binding protein [Candidatus Poseidoniales archaeon]
MGGTDEPSNIVWVSPEEHAELHFALYLEHGNWQDYRAAKGLAKLGGHPCFTGQKHTPKTRARMSAKLKGKKKSADWKRQIGEGNTGKVRSESLKEQISETLTGYKHTDEAKDNMRRAAFRQTAEVRRERARKAAQARWGNPHNARTKK